MITDSTLTPNFPDAPTFDLDLDREAREVGRRPWRKAEIDRLRAKFEADTFATADGALRWKTNPDSVIPVHVFRDACLIPTDAHVAAREANTAEFLAEYRRQQAATPSAEERFEARAAFGEGVEVVDVISGRRFVT